MYQNYTLAGYFTYNALNSIVQTDVQESHFSKNVLEPNISRAIQ